MLPNGYASSAGLRIMQSSTGQNIWQTGAPAQPVQAGEITAIAFGLRLRRLIKRPLALLATVGRIGVARPA